MFLSRDFVGGDQPFQGATMLKAGDNAPRFEAEDQDGKPVTLDALLAAGPLVLYFYPADFTPG